MFYNINASLQKVFLSRKFRILILFLFSILNYFCSSNDSLYANVGTTLVPNHLVGYWSMDNQDVLENSSIFDRSGNNNTAWIYHGSTGSGSLPTSGKIRE